MLVAGGTSSSGPLASAEVYDPRSGTWAATGSMTEDRADHTATLLRDGKVLVAGGAGSLGILASAELYDPGSGSWTVTGSMVAPRASHTATLLLNGTVLVAGGATTALAEVYDPSAGKWTATRSMAEARFGHTATLLLDGTVLVAGGGNDSAVAGTLDVLATAELYHPTSGSWTPTGGMVESHTGHTATLLQDGTVLVAGGNNIKPASAELYDPRTGSWAVTGNLVDGRQHHTATLLPDGRVLVAGGFLHRPGSDYPRASAELYDPRSGNWTATASMNAGRAYHTATLLPDGTVLAVGGGFGNSTSGSPLASAELFHPSSGT